MALLSQILLWWNTDKVPTKDQRNATFSSFRLIDDAVPITEVYGLTDALNAKAATTALAIKADLVNGKVPLTQLPAIDSTLGEAVTANLTVGGVAVGYQFPSTAKLLDVVKKLITTVYQPVIVEPVFAHTNNAGAIRKVGDSINLTLSFSFNRGSITVNGVFQNSRAGAATGFTFMNVSSTPYANMPSSSNSYVLSNYVAVLGLNTFKAKVDYAIGSQPKDSNNANVGSPLAAGSSNNLPSSFEGVYPILATVTAITAQDELALQTMLSGVDVYFTAKSQLGTGNKQKFWLPTVDGRGVAIIAKNGLTNLYTLIETSSWTVTTGVTIGGLSYVKYEYNSTDRGAIDILIQLR